MKVIIDKVKIHEVGQLEDGVSKTGNAFKSLDFIIAEEREDDMGDIHVSYLQVSCLNQKAERVANAKLKAGDYVRISLDVYSELYKDKWYSKVRLIGFKILPQSSTPNVIGTPAINEPQCPVDGLEAIFGRGEI